MQLMAVKDTYVAPQYWNHIAHWYGDIRNTDTRVHQEVKAMQNLSNVPDVDNVVGYIGSSVDNATCSYRLYMEYCPLGDLWYSMWTHLDYEEYVWTDVRDFTRTDSREARKVTRSLTEGTFPSRRYGACLRVSWKLVWQWSKVRFSRYKTSALQFTRLAVLLRRIETGREANLRHIQTVLR